MTTIKQLEYLDAIARTGSFTAAAARCYVTQSTLSSGIATLESQLKHNLVERTGRKARLSAIGERVLEKGRVILSEARNIAELARAAAAPLSGPLRLGVIPTIAPYFLPQLLQINEREYPRMSLKLHEGQSTKIVAETMDGALDLILLAFPYDMPGMHTMKLFEEDFFVAVPKTKRIEWGMGKEAEMKILNNIPLLLLEEGHCLRDHALAACKLISPKNKGQFSATSMPTLIQLVRQGYGATLLPEMCVKYEPLGDDIDVIAFKGNVPKRTIGLAWRNGHPRHEEFEMLGKAIRAYHIDAPPAG